jgi:hypothetical protein
MFSPLASSTTAVSPSNPVEVRVLATSLDLTIDSLSLPRAGVMIDMVITAAATEAISKRPETITLSINF